MLIEFKNKVFTGSNNRQSLYDCHIPENAKGVIIFTHGYKGYKDWGAWGLMEAWFLNQNLGFVRFNISHNGGTIENPIDFPDLEAFGNNRYSWEVNDLNIMIDETYRIIHQECDLDIPLILLGHSRGGGVSVLAANNNDKVDAVISLAGISDIESRFPTDEKMEDWKESGVYYVVNGRTKQEMPHYFDFYKDFVEHKESLNIRLAAEELTMPFVQIHGDMDLAVSISEGLSMAAWTDTELEIVKGAGHTFGAVHPWGSNDLPEDFEVALQKASSFINTILDKN